MLVNCTFLRYVYLAHIFDVSSNIWFIVYFLRDIFNSVPLELKNLLVQCDIVFLR